MTGVKPIELIHVLVPLLPLSGAVVAGLCGRWIGRAGSHSVTILGVFLSFFLSCIIASEVMGGSIYGGTLYQWMSVGPLKFEIGFLIDNLTVMMMLVVTFVSLMVHIYTIGYMSEDAGYQRFFAYISLFTFSMLMLVMSNNFLQLFFGWEAVGLVSYLLIGFWYTKPSAIYANLKAFLVNRVGDFGFLIGIGIIFSYTGTLAYSEVFDKKELLVNSHMMLFPGLPWAAISVACIGLFVGAMGKSAQFPLHVWLPDSMEGPTPISALIHAATMVTAGIFMVARMSPLFELSDAALSVITIVGAITALFMGFLGIVQNDIKRVVAYSTLSQLGYMTVALGVSAYPVAVFHLMTHAFFKALLFLAAGSVIMGVHHNQDMRYMGGLRKYMPITWMTALIGNLALIGTPFLSGFYSKDSIIEAVHESHIFGSGFAYFSVLAGVFVTAFYSFRMYFLVFHGKERFSEMPHDDHHHDDDHHHGHHTATPHESALVVTLPLVLLAIPSLVVGYVAIEPMLYGEFFAGVIDTSHHAVMGELHHVFHGASAMAMHALLSAPFFLAVSGVVVAWYFYLVNPAIPAAIKQRFSFIYRLLDNKYYLDCFNEWFFAGGSRGLGHFLWRVGDRTLIDGVMVNGTAGVVRNVSGYLRVFQSGYIYHYAFAMLLGVVVLLAYWGGY